MAVKKHKSYILLRLKEVGREWDVLERVKKLYGKDLVPYGGTVYGAWDLIIEVTFSEFEEVDKVVTGIREDELIAKYVSDTTTMTCALKDFPWD